MRCRAVLAVLIALSAAACPGARAAARRAKAAKPPADVIRTGGPSAPSEPKIAVVASSKSMAGQPFSVVSSSGQTVFTGTLQAAPGSASPWKFAALADFSSVTAPGGYTIKAGKLTSAPWSVDPGAGSALVRRLLRVFAINADGNEPNPVFGPSHLNDAHAPIQGGPTNGGTVDVSGGWRDAGDAIKFTVNEAMASVLLDYSALLDASDAPALRSTSDVGIRFLQKAHPNGSQTFIAQVGDGTDHFAAEFRDFATDDASPDPALSRRIAYGDAGSAALGAGAAALALASTRSGIGKRAARQLQSLASQWYARGKAVAAPGPPLGPPNAAFQQNGDPSIGFYTDWQSYMALAAVELYRAGGPATLLDDAMSYLQAVDFSQGLLPGFYVGPLVAADLCGALGRAAILRQDVRDAACADLAQAGAVAADASHYGFTAFGTPGEFFFGWTQDNSSQGAMAAAAARAGLLTAGRAIAAGARDYLLGRNPWGAQLVVGPAPNAVHNPYHSLVLKGDPVTLGDGLVVGGPAAANQFPAFGLTPNPQDRFAGLDPTYAGFYNDKVVYEDQHTDFITDEVGLMYSAPAILLVAQLIAG